jgi:hypothetical protein
LLRLDGPRPWGMFRNWSDGRDLDHWHGDPNRPLTDTEREAFDRWRAEAQAKHEEEAAKKPPKLVNRRRLSGPTPRRQSPTIHICEKRASSPTARV